MTIRFARALVISISLLAFLCGCADSGFPLAGPPQSTPLRHQEYPQQCLAISGGGIRSGAVSLGVLQRLYQGGALAKIRFVSTVSGGGYPVYGLLVQMLEEHKKLSELLEKKSAYVETVEDHANFIGDGDIFSTIMAAAVSDFDLGMFHQEGSGFRSYEIYIQRTFSGKSYTILSPIVRRVPLSAAANVRALGFPTPIFVTSANAGVSSPMPGHNYTLGDVFELAPTDIGAKNFGYYGRHSGFSSWLYIIDAVAASASGIDTPQGSIQLPGILKKVDFGLGLRVSSTNAKASVKAFRLEDGGFIDNLGLMPLLRRRCVNIVAFDNSFDERPFGAWTNLKRRIDHGEAPGWRVTRNLKSRVGGLSVPKYGAHEVVSSKLRDSWRWHLPEHVWDAYLRHTGGPTVHLTIVKLGMNKEKMDQYPLSVRLFAQRNWATSDGPACHGHGLHKRCSFPLESTARQSFTKHEFDEYRKLGYWLAGLVVGDIKEN